MSLGVLLIMTSSQLVKHCKPYPEGDKYTLLSHLPAPVAKIVFIPLTHLVSTALVALDIVQNRKGVGIA